MSVTPTESPKYPIVEALKNIGAKSLSTKVKTAVKSSVRPELKPLIRTLFKYVIASVINRFTGEKFECLRNLQESSGDALWQLINNTFSPILNKVLQQINDNTSTKLDKVKGNVTTCAQGLLIFHKDGVEKGVGSVFEKTGVEQSLNVTKTFVEIACDLLSHTEDGTPPQTVTRLLTIAGVLYTGNEDLRSNIDKIKYSLLHEFFKKDGILSFILKRELGKKLSHPEKIVNLVEKLVISLHIKNFVDDFLTHTILSKKCSAEVLRNGDVYEKLILKGVSTFVGIKGAENLSLDELLKTEKLSKDLKEQLQKLQKLFAGSRLTRGVVLRENSLVPKLLVHFKDKDIVHMTNEDLKEALLGFGKKYVKEGAKAALDAVAVAAGTAAGTAFRCAKEGMKAAVGAVKEKGADLAKKGLDATAVATGTLVGTIYRYVSKGACWLGEVWGKSTSKAGLEEEKELEDDFGAYLQALFDENPKPEAPKTIGEQNETARLEPRSVEQKEEESTGVMDTVAGVAVEGAKLVGKGVLKTAEVTGKVVVAATPVVTKVAVGTVKVGGGVLWGLAKFGWHGAKALYDLATGSSAESEPGKVAQKTEVEVPKGSAPGSQTAQEQRKGTPPKGANPIS